MTPDQLARFEAKVHAEPNTGCFLWVGSASEQGYGYVGVGGGKLGKAHRVSYEHFVGPIPPGLCVLHRCDTPACVNPDHLFVGTKLDNSDDMIAKGRARSGIDQRSRTHCRRGHAYDETNTGRIPPSPGKPNGSRVCRTCDRDRTRAKRRGVLAS
jgi:hypothetical protein